MPVSKTAERAELETSEDALGQVGMHVELSASQRAARLRFREFAQERIVPHADLWDRQERLPKGIIDELRQRGYLAAQLPREDGGAGMDAITYGLLTGELVLGRPAVRSPLSAHATVVTALPRWSGRLL